MLLISLRRVEWSAPVYFAPQSIFYDVAAPLVELVDPAALARVRCLCREVLFLIPRLATIRTD
eukprot:6977795-Lingulodinium_polyedra.AAC.1